MTEIILGSKKITNNTLDAYIIAEIGVNYYEIAKKESLSLVDAAKKMIEEAKKAGADAVKFQIYKAERLASKKAKAYWDTSANKIKNQLQLFRKYDKLTLDDYEELINFSRQLKIDFVATPFDEESAEFVAKHSPFIKIASADITNIPFLKKISKLGKPIVLSTGASNISEIYEAVKTIEENNKEIALLHCILEYPTPYEHSNLLMIKHLKEVFPNYIIGYSDHTKPDASMLVLSTAILLGARIIEKHFTLDKTLPGNDHFHSMDPKDLKLLKHNLTLLKKIMGKEFKEPLPEENKSRLYARRSIIARKTLKAGEIITPDAIEIKRPGTGIEPKYYELILYKKVKKEVKKDEPLTWDHLLY